MKPALRARWRAARDPSLLPAVAALAASRLQQAGPGPAADRDESAGPAGEGG